MATLWQGFCLVSLVAMVVASSWLWTGAILSLLAIVLWGVVKVVRGRILLNRRWIVYYTTIVVFIRYKLAQRRANYGKITVGGKKNKKNKKSKESKEAKEAKEKGSDNADDDNDHTTSSSSSGEEEEEEGVLSMPTASENGSPGAVVMSEADVEALWETTHG